MATKIKLVQGDNRPYITLTLREADGSLMDLTNASVAVLLRATGADQILSTLACTPTGSPGKVTFGFPGSTLDIEAGEYEGEVRVVFGNGDRQTVYEVLKFSVRAKFA